MARSSTMEKQPQVYIDFHATDLRHGFVSHLRKALLYNHINVFIDDDEDRGQPIGILLKRIEECRIALVIFSNTDTESSWCLRKLAKIVDCVKEGKMMAIPIFYKLDPSTVRGLTGQYGAAFRDLVKSDAMKNKEWKHALKWISSLMGITVKGESYGPDLDQIVEYVKLLLANIPSEGSQESSVDPSENIETGF